MLITKSNPVGVDAAIQRLQTKLHTYLVDKWTITTSADYECYGRCYRNKKDTGYIAEVFTTGKDYKEVYWNDTLKAISFFGASDKVDSKRGMIEQGVHLVFFVNATKLKPAITHRADEEVRKDVAEFFSGLSKEGFQYMGYETGVENVLKEYPGTRTSSNVAKLDMQPVHSFRINLKGLYQYC
jgi:hypothetical protein